MTRRCVYVHSFRFLKLVLETGSYGSSLCGKGRVGGVSIHNESLQIEVLFCFLPTIEGPSFRADH